MCPVIILVDHNGEKNEINPPPPSFQERESELAQIRSRFQKGSNMWKNKDEASETTKNTDIKVGQQTSETQMTELCLTSHKMVTFS